MDYHEIDSDSYINITIEDMKHSLLDVLRDRGYYLPAWCGGRGDCGKCRVRFLQDAPEAEERAIARLSEEEIKEGWRLACLTRGAGTYMIEIPDHREDHIRAAGKTEAADMQSFRDVPTDDRGKTPYFALSIDLGTTTIAASLVDTANRKVVRTVTGINHQRAYGADVLSRIDAANRGEGAKLHEIVREDINDLCEKLGIGNDVENLCMTVILSGNSTMEHLLQGLSCENLGVFPFMPVDISMHQYGNMTILPGISTYVGADIVSGIVACGIDQRNEISILIDLGTNGEMVIGNKNRILTASTAAGPAFEGGNISCGMAGIPGAIDRVEIRGGKTRITTICDEKPTGICGTGVLETVYELVKEGIVDETGLLDEKYFEQGYPLAEGITFSAGDVREVQLAKSAIRAGIEILLRSFGVSYEQVDRIYLAGGFGQKLDYRKAVGIGMLPEELADKIVAVGNSSLEGACMLAMDPALAERFVHITEMAEEIILANHEQFNDLYMEYMFFDV